MVSFTLNDMPVQGAGEHKLMDFLRSELGLTSVKDGCSEGACGTCTILVNGKATRACLFTLAKLEGQAVVTIEGLSEREKNIYSTAFAVAGAVQCGFCTPGMVMAAKALLDIEPNPTLQQVKKALRGNICRCTGYVKIEQAVLLAAQWLRADTLPAMQQSSALLGENMPRVDAADKTLGRGIYVDDITIDGMLHASAVRSAHPRARVLNISTEKALAHPECVAALTAKDVPGNNKIGHLAHISDWDVLIAQGDVTRYVGDAIVLVVAKSLQALSEIKELVEIDYEVLEPLCSPAQALAHDAPKIHEGGNILAKEHLVRGDAKAALEASAHVVSRHYSLPFTEHAFLEPECAIALPAGESLMLYTAGQSIYDEQREVARMLGIAAEKVHVKGQLVGGGFGGKEDMSVQHHAALAAWYCKQAVKVKLSRKESLTVHPKRHAMEIDFTTGCDQDGHLTAVVAHIISDTGAYASLGGPVLQRACTHAAGPYNFHNIDIEGIAVYTNNPPGGAFRGFGVSQTAFAMESNLNLLAQKVGISAWEMRYRNAVLHGQVLPNGQIADGTTGLANCLLAVKPAYEAAKHAGIASFFKNSGIGVGLSDIGRCIVEVKAGMVHIRTSAACIGQGLATVLTQIACETLALPPQAIVVESPDTQRTPNSGTTTASRQTFFTGEATRRAAALLRQKLDEGHTLLQLDGSEFLGEYSGETDPMASDKPNPVSHVAYGYAAEVVVLSDDGKIEKITAAYDMGQVINPIAAQGQIEGGIVMGLGYALTEDFPLKDGHPIAKFGTLGLWRTTEVPPMEVHFVHGPQRNEIAYGAKGCGELATIPTAPAVAGAYLALDGIERTTLPMEQTYYRKQNP